MRDWDDMSTGEFWAKRKREMDEDIKSDRERANSPQGKLDAAHRKLEALTAYNDGWGTTASKEDIAATQAAIDNLNAEMGRG